MPTFPPRQLMPLALILVALAPAATPAAAQTPAKGMSENAHPACPAPVAPTGAYAPWASAQAVEAGRDAATAPVLPVGGALQLALAPTPQVHYALRPEKPGGSVSFGGVVALDVAQAGSYRIALGSAAWLDVVRDGQAVMSTAHGHGPDCTGIRKMVDFTLSPGRYLVQVSANGAPQLTVMAIRQP